MPSGLFNFNSLTISISNKGCLFIFLLSSYFIEILVFNANSVDLDQTSCCAASDLSIHFLLMSLLWDARHTWVKAEICFIPGGMSKTCLLN